MAWAIDRVKLLYAVGILLGVAAIAYFGFRVLDQLSPVTNALLLFAGFALFVVVAAGFELGSLDTVAYALGAGCYLVFVAYTVSAFGLGADGTFLLLAASSVLFIGLGSLANRGSLRLSRRNATVAAVVVLAVAGGVVAVDVVGAQPSTSAAFDDSVEIPDRQETVALGTVTVENEFLLHREATVTRYHACVYAPERRDAPLRYEPSPGSLLLAGGESRTFEVRLPGVAFYENDQRRAGVRDRESVPVETAEECPETTDESKVVVVPRPLPRGR